MLFMVVERFAPGKAIEVYRVARERGRMLPEGLVYIDSWVSAALHVCFQLMECEDPVHFQQWVANWGDLAEIEIVPVTHSRATAELMARMATEP